MIILKFRAAALAMSCAAVLSACGGGGDSGTPPWSDGSNSGSGNGGVSGVSSEKATQRSVSFSAEKYNLDWSFDGTKAAVTIRVADTAGNPLPKGTKVQFSVSGGQIVKTCTTGSDGEAGATGCSVDFSTSNPRPSNGIVSVIAWLVGEESYKDLNGNGKYDNGEPFYESGTLFRDDDGDGAYTPGVDELVVGTTLEEGRVGVGTSACRQDAAAKPTEVPLSVPGTCDGVWGKTLVRAQSYFAVSDPRRLGAEQATDDNGDPIAATVLVYTLATDGVSKVAPVSGTAVTVDSPPAGCSATVSPTTVSETTTGPSEHVITATGTCGSSLSVKATSGAYSVFASVGI